MMIDAFLAVFISVTRYPSPPTWQAGPTSPSANR
jgi:hypothetical protein